MNSWNAEGLSKDVKELVAFNLMQPAPPWANYYMIEFKLDDPVRHLSSPKPTGGLKRYAGEGKRDHATHVGDKDWCVIHLDDEDIVQSWNIPDLFEKALVHLGIDGK